MSKGCVFRSIKRLLTSRLIEQDSLLASKTKPTYISLYLKEFLLFVV